MISGRDLKTETRQRSEELHIRYARLHEEMVEQFERLAVARNYGLICVLVGWQYWLAATVANYLLTIGHGSAALWPLAVWAIIAGLTVMIVRGRCEGSSSPLAGQVYRLWLIFFLLAGQLVVLQALTDMPIGVLVTMFSMLGAFGFAVMAAQLSRRFFAAALLMMASAAGAVLLPSFTFFVHGCAWVIVLQTLGLELMRKRTAWLAEEQYRSQVLPFTRLGS